MTQTAAAPDVSEMTRVHKVRVQILAEGTLYEGYVHLIGATARIQDVLNDAKPFLNLTDVVIHDRNNAQTAHVAYCALNKGAVTHVLLLAGDQDGRGREEPTGKQKRRPATVPLAAMPQAPAAPPTHPPMVPPAGPKTIPGPSPTGLAGRVAGDPPTQPFPKEAARARGHEDDMSDLILDDEVSDDIDPDDLERDLGALITGAPKN
jgi:hypothetical protein